MSASLVGSEMCIRDSACAGTPRRPCRWSGSRASRSASRPGSCGSQCTRCLLYTSDAADDM
eukprot:4270973-Alexandrium_andersonii.AAC.1